MEFKRKLYTRGSSYETTIPAPILFSIDKSKKHNVVFTYSTEHQKWFIDVKEVQDES